MGNIPSSCPDTIWTPTGTKCVSCPPGDAVNLTSSPQCLPGKQACNNQLVSSNGTQLCVDCPYPGVITYVKSENFPYCVNPTLPIPNLTLSPEKSGVNLIASSVQGAIGYVFCLSSSPNLDPSNIQSSMFNKNNTLFVEFQPNEYYAAVVAMFANGQISQLSNVVGVSSPKSYQQTRCQPPAVPINFPLVSAGLCTIPTLPKPILTQSKSGVFTVSPANNSLGYLFGIGKSTPVTNQNIEQLSMRSNNVLQMSMNGYYVAVALIVPSNSSDATIGPFSNTLSMSGTSIYINNPSYS